MKTHHLIGSMKNCSDWEEKGLFVSKNTRRITIPGCGGNESLLMEMLDREHIPQTNDHYLTVYISEPKEIASFKDQGYKTENRRIMSIYTQDEKAKLPDRQWMSVIIDTKSLILLKELMDSKLITTRTIQAA